MREILTNEFPPDHRSHHPLHGRREQRQPRPQGLLHLGLPLRRLLRVLLLPDPGDQGPVPRTGRPHVRGDDAAPLQQVGAALHLRGRHGHDGEEPRGDPAARGGEELCLDFEDLREI